MVDDPYSFTGAPLGFGDDTPPRRPTRKETDAILDMLLNSHAPPTKPGALLEVLKDIPIPPRKPAFGDLMRVGLALRDPAFGTIPLPGRPAPAPLAPPAPGPYQPPAKVCGTTQAGPTIQVFHWKMTLNTPRP